MSLNKLTTTIGHKIFNPLCMSGTLVSYSITCESALSLIMSEGSRKTRMHVFYGAATQPRFMQLQSGLIFLHSRIFRSVFRDLGQCYSQLYDILAF